MSIAIRHTAEKGRGVFAIRSFNTGETIELAPVIPIPADQRELIHQTVLRHFYFEWGDNEDEAAMVLGYGALYNHSYQPNAAYVFRESECLIEFVALREIRPDEEILINYNGVSGSLAALWFDVAN